MNWRNDPRFWVSQNFLPCELKELSSVLSVTYERTLLLSRIIIHSLVHCFHCWCIAHCWCVVALLCFASTGASDSIAVGSNKVGFRGSDAVSVEIRCRGCCDCSSNPHAFNRSIDTMSLGRPTHWIVHWRRFSSEVSDQRVWTFGRLKKPHPKHQTPTDSLMQLLL